MDKNMAETREKEVKWIKQADMTLKVIRESLNRTQNLESSLKALTNSLTAEIATIETLIEALESQLKEIGKLRG